MYSLGWRVFRDHVAGSVPADRRRRSLLVGALVAVAAAVLLVAVGLVFGWPDLRTAAGVVGLVLLALAAGVAGVALVPLRPRAADGTRLYWGTQISAPDPIERYFRRGPAPTIDPADRADVLRDADAVRAGLVPEVYRTVLLLVLGVLLFGAVIPLHVPGVWPVWLAVVGAVRLATTVTRLGRVERARALATVLPDVPARPVSGAVRPGRPGTPSGSKLALPGDDR